LVEVEVEVEVVASARASVGRLRGWCSVTTWVVLGILAAEMSITRIRTTHPLWIWL
jgi:hypothetical protein